MKPITATVEFDVVVVGSGFAGSILSMVLARRGLRVQLLEASRHPRFIIGESSTPLANLLLEEIAQEWDLPELLPFCQWGTWQRHHPDVPVGLKRGFSFLSHAEPGPNGTGADLPGQLLVAASPTDAVADTHWYRPAFDELMVRFASNRGVSFQDQTQVIEATRNEAGWAIRWRCGDREGVSRARLLVDATGPRGLLNRLFSIPESRFEGLPPTQALYAHFSDVGRVGDQPGFRGMPGLPYPVDDAALHHLFDGGWIWVLRFNNGLTSAGAALTDREAARCGLEPGAEKAAWTRLIGRFPGVQAQFDPARAVTPFFYSRRIAFRTSQVVGPGWAMLPSAAGVVDPLLSTGFPLTLLGIQRLARLLTTGQGLSPSIHGEALAAYEQETLAELDLTAALVGSLYRQFNRMAVFSKLAMIYFAAASYAEMARRLGKHELAPGFLLRGRPGFAAGLLECCRQADALGEQPDPSALARFDAAVTTLITPVNVAGLDDPAKGGRYGVEMGDVIRGAAKLGVSAVEVEQLLSRMGVVEDAATAGLA